MSEEKKKGLFSRLKEGMQKTRDSLTRAIDQLTGYYKELDDEFYDDLEAVLIGADIRPNCIDALQKLVGKIKNELVVEKEVYAE